MNTPQTFTPSIPAAESDPTPPILPPAPKRNPLVGILVGIIIILTASAVGFYGWIWTHTPSITPTTSNTNSTAASNSADDPVTQELGSISSKSDTATLSAEIADTPTEDLTTELDNIDAAVNGL